VIAAWNGQFRCVTTSLLGYGGTADRRSPEDCCIAHEVEMLEAVLGKTAVPVHLVGHSFGGLVAIALALRSRALLASLTVLEAPAVELLRHGPEDQRHYRDFREMTDRYFAAFAGGDVAAVRLMIDFYGGPETFASWPQRVREYAIETTGVNIRDWAGAFGFRPSPDILVSIDVPSLVAWGQCSHPAVRQANSLLGTFLKASISVEIRDAAHFMISTHAQEVAQIIAGHVLQVEEPKLRSNLRQPTDTRQAMCA
jgi:pimeloyl-ACP methyl ester carboxylesterase